MSPGVVAVKFELLRERRNGPCPRFCTGRNFGVDQDFSIAYCQTLLHGLHGQPAPLRPYCHDPTKSPRYKYIENKHGTSVACTDSKLNPSLLVYLPRPVPDTSHLP